MIHSCEFQGKTIKFYNDNVVDGRNIFTTIVGKNGSGKSRLLRHLITTYINLYKRAGVPETLLASINTFQEIPSNIIALSTSPFDRFPIGNVIGGAREDASLLNDVQGYYYYHGLRGLYSSNLSISFMTRIIGGVIKALTSDNGRLGTVLDVLDYLGYHKNIKARFICGITSSMLTQLAFSEDFLGEREKLYNRGGADLKRVIGRLEEMPNSYRVAVFDAIKNYVGDLHKGSIEVSISVDGTLNALTNRPIEGQFALLMESGVLRLRDLVLHKKNLEKGFRISDASSGEQCIVLAMLGIASRITDGSLICIDEPEICLHPEWQERYIKLLISTFREFKSCHFIIATHSPQIISRLEDVNCFILDLQHNQVMNAGDYNQRSADFQLAHVFGAPGYKNEYLMRELLAVIGKLSAGLEMAEDKKEMFRRLVALKPVLEPSDPVYQLTQLLEEALGETGDE